MADSSKQEIKLFYCYAREDKPLRDKLEKHLSWLKRRDQLTNWHDREILPGEEWERAIDTHLNTAHLILLLISADFMASDYCYGKEMGRALERHEARDCRVIPILLRPTYWEDAPFSSLQLLPRNTTAITTWLDQDEAFQNVVTEISRTIKDLLISLNVKGRLEESIRSYKLPFQEQIIEQLIELNPNNTDSDYHKARILKKLKRYEEALSVSEQLIELNPKNVYHYYLKADMLKYLQRYEEALAASEQAVQLNPKNTNAYSIKATILIILRRYEETLATCDQLIRLDRENTDAYRLKGDILSELQRYKEALAASEQAIQFDPKNTDAYYCKAIILTSLNRDEEVEQTLIKVRQHRY